MKPTIFALESINPAINGNGKNIQFTLSMHSVKVTSPVLTKETEEKGPEEKKEQAWDQREEREGGRADRERRDENSFNACSNSCDV